MTIRNHEARGPVNYTLRSVVLPAVESQPAAREHIPKRKIAKAVSETGSSHRELEVLWLKKGGVGAHTKKEASFVERPFPR